LTVRTVLAGDTIGWEVVQDLQRETEVMISDAFSLRNFQGHFERGQTPGVLIVRLCYPSRMFERKSDLVQYFS
jgi:hypothetical protein